MSSFPAAYAQMPIQDLVAAPFKAASDANMTLAGGLLDFVGKLGFEESASGSKPNARTVDFTVERPQQTASGDINKVKFDYSVPLLSLVPIPALLIEDVSVDFQMEVTDVSTSTQKTATELDATASAKYSFGFFSADFKVNGRVTTSRENTSSTNQSAKYQIHATARQQPMTQGMSTLLQLLASSMDPLPSANSAASSSSAGSR
ncbi:MAG TPA: DUF2589 domain-containing protein [Burkholderiaceae bacterium]|nr:DUF2589 domain-containing protein [Burkholderiaceae bacterium]HMY99968.1 DUF2589 domain-containing protein [Burkholderiaceae bacterium]HNB43757.1 DUF2589 domain-containing protein [Burkholderiaceae bacterium]HNG79586.1 DUF2589 domain-containing protein [Burkholderiaceae bacterium]